MKRFFVLVLCLCMIAMASCSDKNEKQQPANENNEQSTQQTEEKTDLEAFLDASKSFIDAETGKEATILTLVKVNESYRDMIRRYCVADLDNDGTDEYLFEDSYAGNTAVLHKEGEIWRAYMMVLRERLDIKTDGEMMWSSGADVNGLQRVEFSDGEMKRIRTLHSEFGEDVHYIDGELSSREEADKMWEKFDKKENVQWFDVYPAFEVIEQ